MKAECTQADSDEVADAYKSFPSGHTSFYATGGVFLTLFLIFHLRIFQGQSRPAAGFIALVPAAVAAWVGLTRITDNAHNPTDVLGGYVLGSIVAAFFFAQGYNADRAPSVAASWQGNPLSSRDVEMASRLRSVGVLGETSDLEQHYEQRAANYAGDSL